MAIHGRVLLVLLYNLKFIAILCNLVNLFAHVKINVIKDDNRSGAFPKEIHGIKYGQIWPP